MNDQVIEILNPTGVREVKKANGAMRRLKTLREARVGLLDNNKPNADRFLAQIGSLFEKRFGTVELVRQQKTTRTAADRLAELSDRCDVVVNAFAD